MFSQLGVYKDSKKNKDSVSVDETKDLLSIRVIRLHKNDEKKMKQRETLSI